MSRQTVQRTQVKHGFDPLMQIKKKHDENVNSQKKVKKEEEKEEINNEGLVSVNVNGSGNRIILDNNEEGNNTRQSDDSPSKQNSFKISSSNSVTSSISNFVNNSTTGANSTSGVINENYFNQNNYNISPHFHYKSNKNFLVDREYIKNNFDLIKGESVIDFEEEVYYKNEENNLMGVIVLTDFRLLFRFKDSSLQSKMNFHEDYFKIPLFQIAKLDKSSEKKNLKKYCLDINTKDSRILKFVFVAEQLKFYANLNTYLFPKDFSSYFSFARKYREALLNDPIKFEDGWKIYDPISEYKRQGINFDDENYRLKLSNLNKNFGLCSTYPEVLVVPRILTDEEIREASMFRTKCRFPILSYVYSGAVNNQTNSQSGQSKNYTYASIWRSSQTKSGLTGNNRSSADEKLLKVISQLNEKLVIYDARPYLNALANRIKGGGFENVNNYSNTELHFCEIENIHSVRNSLNKLYSLCANLKIMENKKFLSGLEQTDWYEYIHLILKYSNEIAKDIKRSYSVLVHCSDGWDRSSQLISISEILLDPYYRTFKGFIVIIEKEWLSIGHQFALRNGIFSKEPSEDQRAPIFLQWLDCIHQIMIQFPNAFQFNMDLLLFLASHINSNLYGTFLYNSENERTSQDAKNKTVSIWTDVMNNLEKFANPFYKQQNYVLLPNYAMYKLRFWEEYFLKWNNSIELGRIYLDESKDISFNSPLEYFTQSKIQDGLSFNQIQSNESKMAEALLEVYNITKDRDIYEELGESTKILIETLISKSKIKPDSEIELLDK